MVRLLIALALVACSKKAPLGEERDMLDESARLEAAAQLDNKLPAVREYMEKKAQMLRDRAQKLADLPEMRAALMADAPADRANQARLGFMKFKAGIEGAKSPADAVALVDTNGDVVAMHEVPSVVPRLWRGDDPKAKTIFPALDAVLAAKASVGETTAMNGSPRTPVWIGAASVLDGDKPIGGVVILYTPHVSSSKVDVGKVGAELGYAVENKVQITTLGDQAYAGELSRWLDDKPAATSSFTAGSAADAPSYIVRAIEIPRASTGTLPASYPASPVRLLVFGKVADVLR